MVLAEQPTTVETPIEESKAEVPIQTEETEPENEEIDTEKPLESVK